jgi:hypothetical protein
MDDAFDRLTYIQKMSVNRAMFAFAYNIVVQSRGDNSKLEDAISRETSRAEHLRADLIRYCRLVQSVM